MNNYLRSRPYRHVAGKFIVPKINGIIAPDGGWWYTKDEFYRWVEDIKQTFERYLEIDSKRIDDCEDSFERVCLERSIKRYRRFLETNYDAAEVTLCRGCVMLFENGIHQHYGLPWQQLANCLAVEYKQFQHEPVTKWAIQEITKPCVDVPLYDTESDAKDVYYSIRETADIYEIVPVRVCEGCYQILDRTVFGARFIPSNIGVDSCPIAYTTRGAVSDE